MDPSHAAKLRKSRVTLVNNIDAKELTGYLFQAHIITDEEIERIENEKTSLDRARMLIDIVTTRGPNAYPAFIAALSQYKHYEWLIEELNRA